MADLRNALVALSQGRLGFHLLATTLERHLRLSPKIKGPLFRQLTAAYEDGLIDAHTLTKLRYHISDHSYATPAERQPSDDDPTSILPGRPEAAAFPDVNGASIIDDDTELDIRAPEHQPRFAQRDVESTQPTNTEPQLPGNGRPSSESDISSGSSPSRPRRPVQSGLRPGSVIKDRFILDEVLGVGGMGTVYKGRDLRKVEARDRDPYLALKVLNEDFKKHPDSFIALQREASRQQRLAHPNIATVYDFDRTGSTVFITMELLEGTPLNQFIRQVVKPRGGLPRDEALPMIEGLSSALIYAHERQIVHSDFKPGNCFLTKNKTMKVLDFGIARAVKNPGQGEGEKTLFDPRKLGALTPAYASPEMLEGQHPDPRDDIYALACVSYELLTGRHPFNKLSAKKAKENSLTPLPIKGLNRSQNQTLARGLAYAREDRPQSVAEFLEGLSGRNHPVKNAVVIGAIAGVLIAVLAIGPVSTYIERNHIRALIEDLKNGGEEKIEEVLKALPAMSESAQQLVIRGGRETIIDYFESKIASKLDPANPEFDFAGAGLLLSEARYLYPDSASLQSVIRQVDDGRNELINDFTASFNRHLEEGRLLEDPGGEDIVDVLRLIRQVDPENPLLEDPRLADAYARHARRAHDNQQLDRADAYLQTGLELAPDASVLINLRDVVANTRLRSERVAQAARIERRLQDKLDEFDTLAAFKQHQADILKLAAHKSDSEVLSALAEQARTRFEAHVDELIAEQSWQRESTLIAEYGELITTLDLEPELNRFRQAAEAYRTRLDRLLGDLRSAIAEGRLSPPAQPNAVDLLVDLEEAAPRHPRTLQARFQLSEAYLKQARESRARQQWDAARIQVATARDMETEGLLAGALEAEIAAIANAELEAKLTEPDAERQRRTRQRQTRLAELRERFQGQLESLTPQREDVARALATLEEIASLDPGEPLSTQGRDELGDRLTAQLMARAEDGGTESTLRLAQGFADLLPGSSSLRRGVAELNERHLAALQGQRADQIERNRERLSTLLASAELNDAVEAELSAVLAELSLLLGDDRERLDQLRSQIADRFLADSRAMRAAQRFDEARLLLARARDYAPGYALLDAERIALADEQAAFEARQQRALEQARLDSLKRSLLTQARAKRVEEAVASLETLRVALPEDDPFLQTEAPEAIAGAYHELAIDAAETGDYEAAIANAERGLEFAPGMASLQQALRAYSLEGGIAWLKDSIANSRSLNTPDIRRQLDTIKSVNAARYNAIRREFIDILLQRISRLHEERDPASTTLLQQARQLFPESLELQQLQLTPPPDPSPAPARTETIAAGAAPPPAGGRPCSASLAGHGQRARGTCYDMLGPATQGPPMVVVPAQGPAGPYAIGKYEVTVGEYNAFCRLSGRCEPLRGDDDGNPARGIGAERVQAYAAWLSKITGSRYRLPTVSEWAHAASAEGGTSKRSVNCRVTRGNTVLKGQSVLAVRAGQGNRWGLVNPIGNVQELVRDSDGLRAAGGSYADPLSNCDVSLQKPVDDADELTGFRLVRELG